MAKEVEKFVKELKAIKTRIKDLSPAEGIKIKKTMLANLEKTWAAEDILKEGVIKARASGVQGKKAADFIKHADVAKPMKSWLAALKLYHADLDTFTQFNDEAKAFNADLTKRMDLVEKELKKQGGTADIPTMAAIKEAKRALPELKKSESMLGQTKSFEVMYGLNQQRTVEAIVRQAVESVTPKEFPEPLAEKNRAKTEKTLKLYIKKIEELFDTGQEALQDNEPKECNKAIKEAESLLKGLKDFDKQARLAATKMKKEVKENKDSKKIEDLIKNIINVYKNMSSLVDALKADLLAHLKEAR